MTMKTDKSFCICKDLNNLEQQKQETCTSLSKTNTRKRLTVCSVCGRPSKTT